MLLPYGADELTVRERKKIAEMTSDTMKKVENAYKEIQQVDREIYSFLLQNRDKWTPEYYEALDIIRKIENAMYILEAAFVGYSLLTGDSDSEITHDFSEENDFGANAANCNKLLYKIIWRDEYPSERRKKIMDEVLDKTDAEAIPIITKFIENEEQRAQHSPEDGRK